MIATPLSSKTQLIEYFAQGEKHPDQRVIGTEHERFLIDLQTKKRLSYNGPHGIHTLLDSFTSVGWEPVLDHHNVIAVKDYHHRKSLTLEPGGQFELSGAPLANLHQTYEELTDYEDTLQGFLDGMGIMGLNLGFDPIHEREQISWMPKQRYDIMRSYMPTKGQLGLDMMLRTCTVQVNLDYSSEEDMVKKYRVAMALQPMIAAMFATSPFKDGRFSGFNSFRNHVWQDTDPDRCGFLSFVFEETMGYERYVDYLLDVPMYFVYRDGHYTPASGQSFRSFMEGKLASSLPYEPTMDDWADQTTVAFPEVRLKQFLELRSADCGPKPMLMALPAIWVGLLYDQKNLDALHTIVMNWPVDELEKLYLEAPTHGLQTLVQGQPIQNHLLLLVDMAKEGLKRRHIWDKEGKALETRYLRPLEVLLHHNMNLSDYLQTYHRQQESFDFLWEKHFWNDLDGWLQDS